MAAATYASTKASFSIAIAVVRVGADENISCIGLWVIVFLPVICLHSGNGYV